MFAVAARTLADMLTKADLAMGRLYPSLSRIREVSHAIAVAVADVRCGPCDRGVLVWSLSPEVQKALPYFGLFLPSRSVPQLALSVGSLGAMRG